MAENYALWRVKKGFTDKYTKHRFESGEVAVFERERAAEIVATLGKGALLEVDMPVGFHLTADGDVEQDEKSGEVTEESAATEQPDEKPASRRGKGGNGSKGGSKDNKK